MFFAVHCRDFYFIKKSENSLKGALLEEIQIVTYVNKFCTSTSVCIVYFVVHSPPTGGYHDPFCVNTIVLTAARNAK